MNIVIWIVIILVAVFLIWLLKRWIRRLIFLAILFIIAFFIYGLFSPTWASKLWYNVRTFPDRIVSWFSSKNFVDYDAYKLKLTSVWAEDKSDSDDNDSNVVETDSNIDLDIDLGSDADLDSDNDSNKKDKSDSNIKQYDTDIEIIDDNENTEVNRKTSNQKNVVKSFWNIAPLRFVKMKEKIWNESEVKQDVSWYSKADLMWIISTYIENNLTDDTEILVTIEYSETGEADKIILKTQPKYKSEDGVLSIPRLSLEKMIDWIYKSKYETVVIDDDVYEENVEADEDSKDDEVNEEKENIKEEQKENVKKEEKKEDDADIVSDKDWSSSNDLIVETEWTKEEPKEEPKQEKKESATTTVQPTVQKTTETQATKKTTQVQEQPTTQKTTQTQTKTTTTTQKTTQTKKTSNGLSQKDLRDAEEVLWALF